jgi:hypothetical protein
MKKIIQIVCVKVLLLVPSLAFANNLADCDADYARRGVALFQAFNCYSGLEKNKIISNETYFERAFTTLSAAVNEFSKKPEERKAIDQALVVLEQVKLSLGEKAFYNYWKAVWISFDAVEKDRGSLLPTTMFGRISTIQNLLTSAIKEDPSTHFYGPHRVLGLMHTQMPKIAGGDKKYAEQLLATAYAQQPNYFSNVYSYANILYVNGKNSEALVVLNQFMQTPDAYFEVYAPNASQSLAPEIKAEKAKAQKLILDIEAD